MTKVIILNVSMTCGGCSGAVTRLLGKVAGVSDVEANVETKVVRVTCEDDVEQETIQNALSKWATASNKTVEYVRTDAV